MLHEAIESYLQYCEFERNLMPRTVKAYQSDLSGFVAFCPPGMKLDECDKALLRRYIRHLTEVDGLKETSVRRKVACLKAMFSWFIDQELIEINPFHQMNVRIRLPRRLPRTITPSECRALIRHAWKQAGLEGVYRGRGSLDTTDTGAVDFDASGMLVGLHLLLATGIRVGELESISLPDLLLEEGEITIHGKGDRERKVYLTDPGLLHLLTFYLRLRSRHADPDLPALLIHRSGRPYTTDTVRRKLKQLATSARLTRPITPHMLRHTAATLYLEAGVDIRYVQRLLGHSSISTTQLYTHVSDSSLKEIIRQSPTQGALMNG